LEDLQSDNDHPPSKEVEADVDSNLDSNHAENDDPAMACKESGNSVNEVQELRAKPAIDSNKSEANPQAGKCKASSPLKIKLKVKKPAPPRRVSTRLARGN
jgi:hypothetical protein